MEAWMIWAIVVVVLAIVEMLTVSFFSLCLAFGALCASVGAACGLHLNGQLLLFVLGGLAAFVFVRPVMVKYFLKKDRVKTGVAALVGRMARVTETIPAGDSGRVSVDGDDWKAVSVDGDAVPAGEPVEIVRVESAVVYVKPKK